MCRRGKGGILRCIPTGRTDDNAPGSPPPAAPSAPCTRAAHRAPVTVQQKYCRRPRRCSRASVVWRSIEATRAHGTLVFDISWGQGQGGDKGRVGKKSGAQRQQELRLDLRAGGAMVAPTGGPAPSRPAPSPHPHHRPPNPTPPAASRRRPPAAALPRPAVGARTRPRRARPAPARASSCASTSAGR